MLLTRFGFREVSDFKKRLRESNYQLNKKEKTLEKGRGGEKMRGRRREGHTSILIRDI